MKVKYTGAADERSLTKADLTRHGVEDAKAVKFNHENGFIAEVSDEVGQKLIELDSESFSEVTDESSDDSSDDDFPKASLTDSEAYGNAESSDDVAEQNPDA